MPLSPDRLRVLVACEHALIADTVCVALASGGHDVVAIDWPADDDQMVRRPDGTVASSLPEVGLLMCDLDRFSKVRRAVNVVEGIDAPWVALTGSRRGAFWGALLEAGVQVVRGQDVRLEQIADLLVGAALHRVGTSADERDELLHAWRNLHAHHRA